MGFKKSSTDTAVFYWHNKNNFAIIGAAVDELTITATNEEIIHGVKQDLEWVFKMKDLGGIHWLLNLKINRDKISGTINISQEADTNNILASLISKMQSHIPAPWILM